MFVVIMYHHNNKYYDQLSSIYKDEIEKNRNCQKKQAQQNEETSVTASVVWH